MLNFRVKYQESSIGFENLAHIQPIENKCKQFESIARYNTSKIIVMDQVQKYMDGPQLLRMHLSEYIPQLSTRNADLVP